MNIPTELILQYGGFVLIAGFFAFVLRWLLMTMTEMKKSYEEAVAGFTKVMSNHITDSTAATKELTMMIEEMRRDLK